MTRHLEPLLPDLRCPATGSPLEWDPEGALVAGERRYRVVDGVPLLITKDLSLFDPEAIVERSQRPIESSARRAIRWVVHHPPTLSRSVGTDESYRVLRQLLQRSSEAKARRPRVLVVGGGTLGVGAEVLVRDESFEIIETDVYIGPRTAVVCDAHNLPFADGTFDAVVCQAVLEHVLDPWRVVQEVKRVLAPDGYVYSEVPFMQQVHEGAFDFTRFTHVGHRLLWRDFDEIRSGAQGGPGMALVWSVSYFLRAFLAPRFWPVADRLTSLCLFWLKYFDDRLVSAPGGLDAASGTFFLGRRRAVPLSDRTIVGSYRGGGPSLSAGVR